ncbi:hypothetical protein HDU84_009418 [Entophlyctis sp. JEL0112]|nr:hypothetical protein HDU84_009418 [Entophlyctis sp. JEL0112]
MNCSVEFKQAVWTSTWVIPAILASTNAIVLPYLWYLAVVFDLRRKGKPAQLANVLVPTNALLICAWTFGAVHYTSLSIFNYFNEEPEWISGVVWLFLAPAEVWFSWKRTEPILRPTSAKVHQILRHVVNFLPFCFILPAAQVAIPTTVGSETRRLISLLLIAIGDSPIALFDMFFALTFYQYTRRLGQNLEDLDPKLQIIAKYGLISSLFSFTAVTAVISAIIIFLLDMKLSPCSWIGYHLAWVLAEICVYATGVLMILMKVGPWSFPGSTQSKEKP